MEACVVRLVDVSLTVMFIDISPVIYNSELNKNKLVATDNDKY